MKRLILVACVLMTSVVVSQERIDLTSPENLTGFRLAQFKADFDNPDTVPDEGTLSVTLRGIERPDIVQCLYTPSTTPTATSLLTPFQKARFDQAYAGNATTGSLKQRIFHRLVIMGESATVCSRSLTGSLAGTVP